MLQKLVGNKNLKNVILATTHWSHDSDPKTLVREKELKSSFWKDMISHGSRVSRHHGSKDSAEEIIESLLAKPRVVVKIVDELVKNKKSFDQTDAGKIVDEALLALRAEMAREVAYITQQLKDADQLRKDEAVRERNERDKLERDLRESARMELEKTSQKQEELYLAVKQKNQEESEKALQILHARLAEEKIAWQKEQQEHTTKLEDELKRNQELQAKTVKQQEKLRHVLEQKSSGKRQALLLTLKYWK